MFALDGLDWRSWTAADRASVTYLLLRRVLTGTDLRALYELVGDTEAVAELDRAAMSQPRQIMTDM